MFNEIIGTTKLIKEREKDVSDVCEETKKDNEYNVINVTINFVIVKM